MRVDEEEANPLLTQELVHAGHVAALAKPHTLRAPTEEALVDRCRRVHLSAKSCPVAIEQREERVGGRARDDLESPGVLQRAVRLDEIAVVPSPAVANLVEAVPVRLRELVEGPVFAPRPVHLFFGELDELVDLLRVPLLQKIVGHHREERRAERQGQTKIDAVGEHPLESQEKRRVRLGDGLEEPFFLHVGGGLRMPDERQVRVKDDREVSVRHD